MRAYWGTKIARRKASAIKAKMYEDIGARRRSSLSQGGPPLFGRKVTHEYLDELEATRPQKCEICNQPPPKNRPCLLRDHDHNTLEVRGWLCNQCNQGLGLLGDTPETLQSALAYLERDNPIPQYTEPL
jgi:hypothetical protein